MAVTRHVPAEPYDDDTWRLYDTTQDFAQAHDVAADNPDLLSQLEALWWREAEIFGVLPLDDRPLREVLSTNAPGSRGVMTRLVLRPGQSHLNFTTRLTGTDRDMSLTARLRGRQLSQQGVLVASGCSYGGYVWYVLDEKLHFEHLFLGERVTMTSDLVVPAGDSILNLRVKTTTGRSAAASLCIDNAIVGECTIPTTALNLAMYGLDIGHDPGSQVSTAYHDHADFAFPSDVLLDVTLAFGSEPTEIDTLSELLEAEE
jgi:arylsulfatase